jgi:anti-sigma factor RsiW
MKPTSRGFQRQIVEYLEGDLSGSRLRRFEAALRESEPCRRELEAFRRIRAIASQVRVERLSEYQRGQFVPRLHERIERAYAFRPAPSAVIWAHRAVVAAAYALLVVAVGVTVGRYTGAFLTERPTATQTEATRTENNDAIRTLAEVWVPEALADRLVAIDVETVVAPASRRAAVAAVASGETSPVSSDGENTVAARAAQVDADSWSGLMAMSLPPSSMYGETASYLLASLR